MATADPIGFLLVTHSAPAQVVRLVKRLDDLFDRPPVVCHHDFSQCDLPVGAFGANVSFVRPHLRTRWGDESVVEAMKRAIFQMYGAAAGPDWCVVLSGADYPIKPAARIIADLNAGAYDAHIRHELIDPQNFGRDWQKLCYHRYFKSRVRLPSLTRKLRLRWRDVQVPPRFASVLTPFSERFRCYAGSNWFSLSRRAARYVIEHHADHKSLTAYCRHVPSSDEMYYQTLLVNAGSLRLHHEDYRYTEWVKDASHPNLLGLDDVAKMLASPCHFARKFAPDQPGVLDAIDSAVDNISG